MPKTILEFKEKNFKWTLYFCEDSREVKFTSENWLDVGDRSDIKLSLDRLNELDNWFSQKAVRSNLLIEKHGFHNLVFDTSCNGSSCSLAVSVSPPTKIPLSFYEGKVLLPEGNTLKETPMEQEDWGTVQEIYERYSK